MLVSSNNGSATLWNEAKQGKANAAYQSLNNGQKEHLFLSKGPYAKEHTIINAPKVRAKFENFLRVKTNFFG